MPAHRSVIVRNVWVTLHLMALLPLKMGTTNAQVQASFDATTGPPPFALPGPLAGTDVLSPGVRLRLT